MTPHHGGRALATLALAACCAAADHHAHHQHHHRVADAPHHGRDPIGVMGGHTHHAGGWMLSLRAMRMHMDGYRDGDDRLDADQVLDRGYAMAGEEMDVDMLMAGVMWAPVEDLTLMAMVPWIRKSMTMRMRTMMMERRFDTDSEGLGDIAVTALYRLPEPAPDYHWHLGLGLSLPTGSITASDDTPMGDDVQLPYAMQLGSGTLDLLPGLTWGGARGDWSWGAQAGAVLRLGENDQGYALGDRFHLTAWGGWQASERLGLSLRAIGQRWGDIEGEDEDLPAMAAAMNPGADPDHMAGTRLDLALGLALRPGGGHRLGAELALPVHEDLDGPQMRTRWMGTLGWQWAF